MNAQALRVEEAAAHYRVAPLLTHHFDSFASAPEGFKRLRELVLNLAVRGRLVPQDPNDEPAEGLLRRIASKKARLISRGEIRRGIPSSAIAQSDEPYRLPSRWKWAQLAELTLTVKSGGTPSKNNPTYWDGPIRWASVKDLGFGEPIVDTQDSITDAGLENGSVLIQPGAVIVCTRMGLGKIGETKIALAINQDLKALQLSDGVNKAYFISFFKTLSLRGTGMTVSGIKQDELLAMPVPLPPLAEQSRIVSKVEELMALIATLEAKVGAGETARGKLLDTLLAALADSPNAAATAEAWAQLAPHFDLLLQTPVDVDRLQQTLLQLAVKGRLVPQDLKDERAAELLKRIRAEKERLVAEGKIKRDKPQAAIAEDEEPFQPPSGWEWVRFGDIHQVAGGVTLGRKLTDKRTVSHPYLRVANVQRGALDLSQIKEVEIAEDELERYCLRHSDLLITEGGDWDKVGRTAIWRSEIEPCLHQNHVFRARRIASDMNVEWVALFMNSAIAMAYFQASAKQTTNLASINMGELKHCAVPLPPLPEQSRIVAAVASLTALCDRLRERLAARRALAAKLAAALTEGALS